MVPSHVYVHVPFCARRCVYCDFAIAVRKIVPADAFISGIEREVEARFGPASGEAAATGTGQVETLYLGGGTPSRLGQEGLARLIDIVRSHWPIATGAEITIEANPEDVTIEDARAWRATGITRVSLGIQSFDDDVLRWMHRTHDAARAVRAAQALGAAGFDDWSLDLIFALPAELKRSWVSDLERAIALRPAHVSCYGLTVEQHTPLRRWRDRGAVHEADEERYEEEFLEADRLLTQAGYRHYEVSNYARVGRRARHNSAYWRRVPYVGLGPSAHSFDGQVRSWNQREYAVWNATVRSGRDPREGSEELMDPSVQVEETWLGLRTSDGAPIERFSQADLDRLQAQGWAETSEGMVRLTPTGWLRLDRIVSDLTVVRSRY